METNKNKLEQILEPIEDYLEKYINRFKKNMFPENAQYKYIVLIFNIIHIIGVFLFIIFGFFLPAKLQIYLCIFYIFVMFHWFILGKCILIMLTNYIGGIDEEFIIPCKWRSMYFICTILIIISFLFYIMPVITPFNILLIVVNKYNKSILKTYSYF